MFETTLLESSRDHVTVLTRRHRIAALIAGLGGFLTGWKLVPIVFFTVNVKALTLWSLLLGAAVALHVLMACYVYAEGQRLRSGALRWLVVTVLTSVIGFMGFLIHSARKTGEWKHVTVPLASVCEVLLLGVLVLVPLVRTQALGLKELNTGTTYLPALPPPRVVAVIRERPNQPTPRNAQHDKIIAPSEIPDKVAQIIEEPVEPSGPDIGVTGSVPVGDGVPDASFTSILEEIVRAIPPPSPPVRARRKEPVRLRVSKGVIAAKLIRQPKPVYPHMAIVARIQGTVRLEAAIGTDGRIQNLQLISGHPLLVEAAMQAVAQWRYQPTLLNGEPVEVLTEIEVKFVRGD